MHGERPRNLPWGAHIAGCGCRLALRGSRGRLAKLQPTGGALVHGSAHAIDAGRCAVAAEPTSRSTIGSGSVVPLERCGAKCEMTLQSAQSSGCAGTHDRRV